MYSHRLELEKSAIISLFGDWTDNPFEIEDWKKMIENLDVELFTLKIHQLIVRAIKKVNSLDEYKDTLPTIDVFLAWIELNAPKFYEAFRNLIFECMEKQPLSLVLFEDVINLLKQYKIKDELRSIDD